MWAVVLVPIWSKSHERSQIEQKLREVGELPAKWHWAKRAPRDARSQAFIRRRRTLMVLLSSLIGAILLSASGAISPILIAIPALLLVAFVMAAFKVTKQSTRVATTQTVQVAPAMPSVPQAQVLPEVAAENSRAWQPVESPVPSYVRAAKATAYPRNLDAQRPWTAQEMLEQAAQLREERNKRLKEAQLRLEEARAVSMEKARRAALGAAHRASANNTQPVTAQEETSAPRAVNE